MSVVSSASDIAAALPNVLPFPIDRIPTWMVINMDTPLELPLMGQFQPNVKRSYGEAIWSKRPGVYGSKPWLRYVGHSGETLKFTFHAIANTIVDLYPSAAWERIKQLSTLDPTLGRPPKVMFIHGLEIVQGHITAVPEADIDFWLNSRMPREIGPVEITIDISDPEPVSLTLSTNYVLLTEDTTLEDVAKAHYGDPRFAASLDEYNQGKVVGDIIEVPRKGNPSISRTVSLSPYFSTSDDIEGL